MQLAWANIWFEKVSNSAKGVEIEMKEEKIVPVLNGAAETMLQSFYARAMYSKNPKHKFKDEKADIRIGD